MPPTSITTTKSAKVAAGVLRSKACSLVLKFNRGGGGKLNDAAGCSPSGAAAVGGVGSDDVALGVGVAKVETGAGGSGEDDVVFSKDKIVGSG